ncbi:MAG: cytochrome c oxidase assembly protein [gamma proteobacterium endosymbiont of Lamellibrachia anaximandri]|nr:cytochrome c oxidase assembly protein [gamma proteobacterium endosymbiont of Lamellibrachia anaximandri]
MPGRSVVLFSLMFALGFCLPPLYNTFSGMTDLNPRKTSQSEFHKIELAQTQRHVQVQWVAVSNENMPWRFKPVDPMVMVLPGQVTQTYYSAYNSTDRQMAAQAILHVLPAEAAKYLHGINCFCFQHQRLRGKERRLMPLQILVSDQLPWHIETITLSYTLFEIPQPTDNDLLATAHPSGFAL